MQLEKIIDSYKNDIIKTTQELVKIRSVEGESKPGMPFGEGPNKALEYTLNIAEKMGLETENFDGFAGHADLGDGEEIIGVLAHLDVVPEGEGWTYPPYGGEIHEDKIYGRGTIDDKGPLIAALYAIKAVKESGLSISKKIRIIFATNEETGWGGIDYYLQKVKAPDLCKAVLEVNEEKKKSINDTLQKFVNKTNYNLSIEDNGKEVVVISKGISAHGSTPQLGQNAVSQLIEFLGNLKICKCEILDLINFYNHKIGMEHYGKSIGCGFEDDVSGKLIFNVGVIELDEKGVKISINIRYPIKYDSETVYSGIKEKLEGIDLEIKEYDHMKPIYMPKEHKLVRKLMDVYREVTGDKESEPITIGGGTYARAMDNAVAFGPLFPGREELAHQKDEYILIDDLIKNAKIYAKAIYELAK